MCSGSKSKLCPSDFSMEGGSLNDRIPCRCSVLLELAASNDLAAFKREVEDEGCDVDEPCFWYGRKIGSRKMGFEERTPLMIASMFGSLDVLKYILGTGKADVNRACGSDKATALRCAVVGGSHGSIEAVKLLLDSSADPYSVDSNGNKPVDLVGLVLTPSRRKALKLLFKGEGFAGEDKPMIATPEKKEYPVDVPLPDINNGIYSSDEFRMYTFKVKPCSRAYSHDWTECPFVHPGENARRRDPRKYPYSCVPCPDFRKGSCPKGDACEYAHGVFESWLHPAQYKTRLCKDETGCARKVCFFAHKPEELRPVYASTGSALPSPKSFSPPLSPRASPKSMGLWHTPPALQLSGSRLKTGLSSRDLDLEMDLLSLENNQFLEEISRLSSPSYSNKDFSRIGDLKPTNFEDSLRSLDPTVLSQLQGLPMTNNSAHSAAHMQSPVGVQMRQNMSQFRQSNFPSSPVRKTSPFGFDSSSAVATAVMNSRSAAMTKRSQSFIDRGASTQGPFGNANSMAQSNLSGWGSPDGKLDWGVRGDELNKLRKSYSFGIRDTNNSINRADFSDEPDVSWVNSLVRDVPQGERGMEKQRSSNGTGNHVMALPWGVDQLYIEQEQTVA
ncbi:zinc finger CCCH domain-containing protein 47 [Punica granatum]|uniref:Zinc finger CCCH domain-containing protein 47 n=2 Tax=Punica granatum TaxID=22663 RepID=A0A6P8C198_PUNGR|nr:zinc finger CCCH domain-containing protein 47 [Punica granatum]XP_031375168.1 zinc finger CCCH domain-containing protein 47 [Punica granatum]OWM87416.1 hypothetical protein CDL15_Pgr022527 [Punica granatum]PKI46671.1 hypothetical protein CRG98_033013 [Punica granatum]